MHLLRLNVCCFTEGEAHTVCDGEGLQVKRNKKYFLSTEEVNPQTVKFSCSPQRTVCNKSLLTSSKSVWVDASAPCVSYGSLQTIGNE